MPENTYLISLCPNPHTQAHTHSHKNAAWVVLSSLLLNTSNNMLSASDMAGLDTSLFTWSFVPHGDTPCRSSACQLPSIKSEQGHQPPPSLPLKPHSLDRRSSAGGILPWPRLSDLLLIATHSEQCILNKTQQQQKKQKTNMWHQFQAAKQQLTRHASTKNSSHFPSFKSISLQSKILKINIKKRTSKDAHF